MKAAHKGLRDKNKTDTKNKNKKEKNKKWVILLDSFLIV